MPTYKNIHPNKESIPSIRNTDGECVRLPYNKTIQTYRYYDRPDELLLVDNAPYWNPVLETTTVTLADSDDFQVVRLDPDTIHVEVFNMSDKTLYTYYQSADNTPYTPIPGGVSRNFDRFRRSYNQLVFKAIDTVSDDEVFVTQYME